MTAFLLGVVLFLAFLTVLAAIADWIDGSDRRDSRRRNR